MSNAALSRQEAEILGYWDAGETIAAIAERGFSRQRVSDVVSNYHVCGTGRRRHLEAMTRGTDALLAAIAEARAGAEAPA